MKRIIIIFICSVFFSFCAICDLNAQDYQDYCKFFDKSWRELSNYQKDFSSIATSKAVSLTRISLYYQDNLSFVRDLLFIFNNIHDERDRKIVGRAITGSIDRIIKRLEIQIGLVSIELNYSKNQNLIILGNQFRRKLREINEKIKLIKFNIIKGGG